jgi:hypothetical protein
MKKILFVSGVLLISIAGAFAQGQKKNAQATPQSRVELRKANKSQMGPEERATLRTQRLDKIVQLNSEQKAKVRAIYLKEAQQNQDRARLRHSAQKEIQAILTADQNHSLEMANQEMMNAMRERRSVERSELKAAPQKMPADAAAK